MALNVITISRQYGSGGRAIGQAVAERLGIPYYDKEILQKLAEESGYTIDYIESQGEYETNTILNYASLATSTSMRVEPSISPNNKIVKMQNELIVRLAQQSPCVIVGRAADYLLRHRSDVLNVFVYADEATRVKCIAEAYDKVSKEEALRIMKLYDRQRKKHYRYYTDRSWGSIELYHIALDSGKLTPPVSVDLLCNIFYALNR